MSITVIVDNSCLRWLAVIGRVEGVTILEMWSIRPSTFPSRGPVCVCWWGRWSIQPLCLYRHGFEHVYSRQLIFKHIYRLWLLVHICTTVSHVSLHLSLVFVSVLSAELSTFASSQDGPQSGLASTNQSPCCRPRRRMALGLSGKEVLLGNLTYIPSGYLRVCHGSHGPIDDEDYDLPIKNK